MSTLENEKSLSIFEISRMATINGPGIRTMVHFKGCNLNCAWCSTPESKSYERQISFSEQKCIGCRVCTGLCSEKAISIGENGLAEIDWNKCINCLKCADGCCSTALSVIGERYSVEEIFNYIMRDKNLYSRSGGGVTFSGGEILTHIDDDLIRLLEKLRDEKISVGFDTAGCVSEKIIDEVLPYADFFLWDIKLLDEQEHKRYTGKSNKTILSNLFKVDESGACIYLRCPIIPGVNDNDDFFRALMELSKKLKSLKEIDLLPFHKLGTSRYTRIGLRDPYSEIKELSEDYLEKKCKELLAEGFNAKIVG